jgi:glycosyltransferase involved in cell wall biosynthesis
LIGGANKVLLSIFERLPRSRFQPFSVIPEPGPLEDELRSRDVRYLVLDLRPKWETLLSLLSKVLRLSAWCLGAHIDLLHANDPHTYRAASIASRICRIPRICHIHHPGQTRESLAWAYRIPPRLTITPSLFMKRQLEPCFISLSHTRLEAVWNPINTDWFRPCEDVHALKVRLGLDPDGNNVCIMAALTPHKGHVCFLRAAQLILRHFPRTSFHIVGGARAGSEDYVNSLHRLARELGIAERIHFWGFVKDELARDLLCASDLLMLPTREEGFGLSVAEAQACQVPVLTSLLSPLDEVVDDGRTGYLIPPDEYEQFAKRAIELLGNAQARKAVGKSGRDWVLQRFSNLAYIQRIMSLYDEVWPSHAMKVKSGDGLLSWPPSNQQSHAQQAHCRPSNSCPELQ